MKKNKKVIALVLLALIVAVSFVACSKDEVISDVWEMDKDNHWHATTKGNKADIEAHSLVEDICSVCGAEITVFDDEIWVGRVNDYGDEVFSMTYDAQGNVVEHKKYVPEYNGEGHMTSEKVYSHGVLINESTFFTVTDEDGAIVTYTLQTTTYNDDGTKLVEDWDKEGWSTREALYNEKGEVVYDYVVKNDFNEMELIESIRKYSGEEMMVEVKFGYDEEGNSTVDKTFEKGVLVKEEYYTNNDGYIYVSKEILYDANGNQTDVIEYDEYGELISK